MEDFLQSLKKNSRKNNYESTQQPKKYKTESGYIPQSGVFFGKGSDNKEQPVIPRDEDIDETCKSIWIGDIENYMDEKYIRGLFDDDPTISSIKLIRDRNTWQLAGYGFIEFKTHKDAERIMKIYNLRPMGNTRKIFKLNWASQSAMRDPNITSVFICDFGTDITESMIMNTFKPVYPSVKSVKIHIDSDTGISKGYGFIRFGNSDEATHALAIMPGKMIGNYPIKLYLSSKNDAQRQMAPTDPNDPTNTTLYVAGIDGVSETEIQEIFQQFGEVTYVKIPIGKKCAFVQYAYRDEAEDAMKHMNGTLVEGNRIRVLWGKSSNPNAKRMSELRQEDAQGNPLVPNSSMKSKIEEMEEKKAKELKEQQDYYAKLHAYYHYMRAVQISIPLNTFDINEDNQRYISTHESKYFDESFTNL
eukprot:gene11889-5216_t